MGKKKYQVWSCKIVISGDDILPDGFDSPPRWAAINAIDDEGINVMACFSGWGGKLTKGEREIMAKERRMKCHQ